MVSLPMLQDSFVRYLPWMRKVARLAFPNLDAEKREEAVANVIALAWKHFHRLWERGRAEELGIVKSIVFYTLKQIRAGRKIDSAAKPRCPLALRAWGKVSFDSGDIDGFVGWTAPVPEVVIFRVDIPRFLNEALTEYQRNLALDLASGMTTTEAAEKYNRTPGAISQFRNRFRVLHERFFGE